MEDDEIMTPKAALSPCCGEEMIPIWTIQSWGPELSGFKCPGKKCDKLYSPEENQAIRGMGGEK